MDIILSLISGVLGGSVVTIVSFILNKKRFFYERKLKAYVEFLEALANVIDDHSSKQQVVYHSQLLKLLAPENIALTADEFFKTDESGFLKIREKLIMQMKNDLRRVR